MRRKLRRALHWPTLPVLDAYVVHALIEKETLLQLQPGKESIQRYRDRTTRASDAVREAQREVLYAIEERDVSIEVLNYELPLLQHLAKQCREYQFPVGQRSVSRLYALARELGISDRRVTGLPLVVRRWRTLREIGQPFITVLHDDFPDDPAEWNGQQWWLFCQRNPEVPFVLPILHAVQELALDEPELFSERSRALFQDFF